MIYQINKICQDVRIAIDENVTSEALDELFDVETLSLDTVITSKIEEAVMRIHSIAPVRMLRLGHNFGDAIFWNGADTCGYVIVPDDFMRLIVFMMDDWDKPVYTPINAENPDSDAQYSRVEGIRGTPQFPKCVLSIRPEGKALEFYSCKTQQAKVSRAVYLPEPKIEDIEGASGIEISRQCYPSAIYMIASLVMAAYTDIDKSKLFENLSLSLLK